MKVTYNINIGTMKKMNKYFGLVALLFGCNLTNAQDVQFTQFYAAPLYLNPAFAGANNCPRVALNYRNQWPALSGTFVSQSASYDQHVDGLKSGLGILVVTDDAGKGTLKTSRFGAQIAPRIPLGRDLNLKFGAEATYFQRSLDWSKLTFGDQIDDRRGFVYQTADVPRGGSVSGIDISAGILLYSSQFFVGFAGHHLNTPNESVISGDSPIPLKLTGHAGANIELPGSKYGDKVIVAPNIMYRQQAGFKQLNMGMYITKGALTAGVWYRNKDAFITTVGITTKQFKFGYSYDVTVSTLTMASAGSHEISCGFNFACRPKKRTYRNITCPSF